MDMDLLSFRYYTDLLIGLIYHYVNLGRFIFQLSIIQDYYIGIAVYISAAPIFLLATIHGIDLIEIKTG
jgi:hypothetical protein